MSLTSAPSTPRRDDLVVAHRPTGLDDRLHPTVEEDGRPVVGEVADEIALGGEQILVVHRLIISQVFVKLGIKHVLFLDALSLELFHQATVKKPLPKVTLAQLGYVLVVGFLHNRMLSEQQLNLLFRQAQHESAVDRLGLDDRKHVVGSSRLRSFRCV